MNASLLLICFRILLRMSFSTAAKIVALRQAISNLIVQSTSDPETVLNPPVEEQELLDMVRQLSKVSATGSTTSAQEALQRYV